MHNILNDLESASKYLVRLDNQYKDGRCTIALCGSKICITDEFSQSVFIEPSKLLFALLTAIKNGWFEVSASSFLLMRSIIRYINKSSR
jgi:hypothetical protein